MCISGYHYSLLPAVAQMALITDARAGAGRDDGEEGGTGEAWLWYEKLPGKKKASPAIAPQFWIASSSSLLARRSERTKPSA